MRDVVRDVRKSQCYVACDAEIAAVVVHRGARMYMAPPMVCMRAPPAALAECREVPWSDTAFPGRKYLIAAA